MTVAVWCMFLGGLVPVLVVLVAKADPRLDVHNPRDVHALQTGVRKRAYGAHLNGYEAFPFFAAGVLTGMLRGVPQDMLDHAAVAWLLLRIAYTAAYLLDLAKVRPILWGLSVLTAAGIFLLPT